jgi:Uma2 family endonuclease
MPILDLPFGLPLTAAEFAQVPLVDGLRMELWDGNLDVSASIQIRWHGHVKFALLGFLGHADRLACTGAAILLSGRTVREPDVTRFRADCDPILGERCFAAEAVDLVVEVTTQESQKRDRAIKPVEYASAGIPEYWLIEEHSEDDFDAVVNIYRLSSDGRYALDRSVDLSTLLKENEG